MSLMWSWHWSPLTQTSLLLSPSDGLASFLKVITSKFRFHLIAIYAFGCFCNFSCTPVPTKITLKTPPPPSPHPPPPHPHPRETSERQNVNVIDKKTINLKTENCLYIDIWWVFFINKMSQNVWATIMPFGPVTLIFYWPKNNFWGQPKLALISGTVYYHQWCCEFESRSGRGV